jgi:bifunctional non-homologous end joining protein LigD
MPAVAGWRGHLPARYGVHEIKHDGYRLMVRRDGSRVRCFTRNGHDWATASRPLPKPLLASRRNGEVVIARDDGTPDFHALRTPGQ